jgi:hypothetical protein
VCILTGVLPVSPSSGEISKMRTLWLLIALLPIAINAVSSAYTWESVSRTLSSICACCFYMAFFKRDNQ